MFIINRLANLFNKIKLKKTEKGKKNGKTIYIVNLLNFNFLKFHYHLNYYKICFHYEENV